MPPGNSVILMTWTNSNYSCPADSCRNKGKILCLVTDKKYRKMGGFEGLRGALEALGLASKYTIEQIRMEEWLEADSERRPDVISFLEAKLSRGASFLVHKHSDFSKMMDKKHCLRIQSYLNGLVAEGRVKVIDDPQRIQVLLSRSETGYLIQRICREGGFEGRGLQWPEFEMKWSDEMTLPVILKPIDACATDESHWMTLINDNYKDNDNDKDNDNFNDNYEDNRSLSLNLVEKGMLVQKFYEHFGVLYKVYVIGEEVDIVARPSISSTNSGPSLRFNTHKFKAAEGELSAEATERAWQRLEPLRGLIEEFAEVLRRELGLTWFGIDVIILEDECALKAAVIDINYMPGYDGIQNLSEKLIKAIDSN